MSTMCFQAAMNLAGDLDQEAFAEPSISDPHRRKTGTPSAFRASARARIQASCEPLLIASVSYPAQAMSGIRPLEDCQPSHQPGKAPFHR